MGPRHYPRGYWNGARVSPHPLISSFFLAPITSHLPSSSSSNREVTGYLLSGNGEGKEAVVMAQLLPRKILPSFFAAEKSPSPSSPSGPSPRVGAGARARYENVQGVELSGVVLPRAVVPNLFFPRATAGSGVQRQWQPGSGGWGAPGTWCSSFFLCGAAGIVPMTLIWVTTQCWELLTYGVVVTSYASGTAPMIVANDSHGNFQLESTFAC